jgi:hypothetical protein
MFPFPRIESDLLCPHGWLSSVTDKGRG